ncbi:MAG: 16S rRNA (uracil(1498)-N(3))-methyltransferase [Candidatus Omnitrophica bacterium]|nr:16S rRNA (uracil(1498)-N(3))-methyltransferase [Candidatus Omnitrophota bacterium]
MRRFFIEKRNISGNALVIIGEEAHHIRDVIRLKLEDKFIGLDGEGFKYICRVEKMDKDKITAVIESKEKSGINIPDIALACAMPKLDKMDYIVQKASELRVKDLIPMITSRTEVKLDEKKAKAKADRWRKIAKESSKQSGRSEILNVPEVKRFDKVICDSGHYKIKLISCLTDNARPIKDVLSGLKAESAIVLIGPEGDFTSKEISDAMNAGFVPVSLGQVVLRVDTACIFAVSVITHELF